MAFLSGLTLSRDNFLINQQESYAKNEERASPNNHQTCSFKGQLSENAGNSEN